MGKSAGSGKRLVVDFRAVIAIGPHCSPDHKGSKTDENSRIIDRFATRYIQILCKKPTSGAALTVFSETAMGAKTAYIEPGSPSETGYCESFNARMRDECFTVKSSTRLKKHKS